MLLTRRGHKRHGSAEQRGQLLWMRSDDFWENFGGWSDDAEWWSSRPWPSDNGDQLALRGGGARDVPLGGLDRPVARQQLHVPQRAACLVHNASGPGDERPAA